MGTSESPTFLLQACRELACASGFPTRHYAFFHCESPPGKQNVVFEMNFADADRSHLLLLLKVKGSAHFTALQLLTRAGDASASVTA
jgi:hypothetical protein